MTALLDCVPTGFVRDGAPHRIVSGALHYFRVHPELWRDRLRRLVALGCNTVETYVPWNLHEPAPGHHRFGPLSELGLSLDLGAFCDLAAEEDLDVIVRPGPYICAEWEGGGLPGWLLRDRSMRLRCMDPAFLGAVDTWFDALIPVIAGRQASRGGRVMMVQVENEYGSYGDDAEYLLHLRDGLRARGIEELLVTSDGPGRRWLEAGRVDDVLATVNFGSRTAEVLAMAREELPAGPLMCMEFWNGWFDHWGEEHHVRDAADAARELETMLGAGMSVNLYMAHGGTNVGLTAGANTEGGVLQPTTTSYDYDAPIAENGALTEKFHAFREVIGRHRELPPLAEQLESLGLEAAPPVQNTGDVRVEYAASLQDLARWTELAPRSVAPPAFEDLGLERGMLLYRRELELTREEGAPLAPLELYDLHDRALVLVDGILAGPVEGTGNPHVPAVVPLDPVADRLLPDGGSRRVRLEILVESLGRTNFGPLLGERKGVLGGVWRDVRFLGGWEAVPLPLEEMGTELADHARTAAAEGPAALPLVVLASLEREDDETGDVHLNVSGCGHGVAYVNGTCVGRYWRRGPQQSLYVPAPLLHAGSNEIVLVELEAPHPCLALAAGPLFETPPR